MDEGTLKEARKSGNVGKNMGHAVGGGELENRGKEPLRLQKMAPKKVEKIFIWKSIGKCVLKSLRSE